MLPILFEILFHIFIELMLYALGNHITWCSFQSSVHIWTSEISYKVLARQELVSGFVFFKVGGACEKYSP